MDNFKCRITDVTRDYKTGQARITLSTDKNIFKQIDELADKDLNCKLVRYHKQRSLDANAYCWVLLDKLSAKLNVPKEELYRNYIRYIGDNSTTICVQNKAVDELCEKWSYNGLGWQTDTFDSKVDGCTNVILYYGSSTYNTEQMNRLIDLIVQDCCALEIETKTPDELAELIARWGENEN